MSCSSDAQSSTSRSTLRPSCSPAARRSRRRAGSDAPSVRRPCAVASRSAAGRRARLGRYDFVGQQPGHVAPSLVARSFASCYCRSMRGHGSHPGNGCRNRRGSAALLAWHRGRSAASADDRLLAARRRSVRPGFFSERTSSSPRARASATSRATRRWSGRSPASSSRRSRRVSARSRRRRRARRSTRSPRYRRNGTPIASSIGRPSPRTPAIPRPARAATSRSTSARCRRRRRVPLTN